MVCGAAQVYMLAAWLLMVKVQVASCLVIISRILISRDGKRVGKGGGGWRDWRRVER